LGGSDAAAAAGDAALVADAAAAAEASAAAEAELAAVAAIAEAEWVIAAALANLLAAGAITAAMMVIRQPGERVDGSGAACFRCRRRVTRPWDEPPSTGRPRPGPEPIPSEMVLAVGSSPPDEEDVTPSSESVAARTDDPRPIPKGER
jgi:hypothetical protein